MIIDKFSSAYLTRKQAKEYADTLIVNTALSLAPSNETVIVVGEDVDLLVILIGLCRAENVFFLRPGKDTVSPAKTSPTNAVSSTVAENILFLYAMSGCDITSAMFVQGKIKFLKTLEKNQHIVMMLKYSKTRMLLRGWLQLLGNVCLSHCKAIVGRMCLR
ncbi:hypothetical protein PR048_006776 [Dryococelus australis]|uniref:Uncharacterized protein n=1 Tax=Dryococelus australis TaxID=614101 RepID=A0ABQ9IBZ7_9NEOP|nr:hypothetical protein PR048_006776 [Dryococelus australis]